MKNMLTFIAVLIGATHASLPFSVEIKPPCRTILADYDEIDVKTRFKIDINNLLPHLDQLIISSYFHAWSFGIDSEGVARSVTNGFSGAKKTFSRDKLTHADIRGAATHSIEGLSQGFRDFKSTTFGYQTTVQFEAILNDGRSETIMLASKVFTDLRDCPVESAGIRGLFGIRRHTYLSVSNQDSEPVDLAAYRLSIPKFGIFAARPSGKAEFESIPDNNQQDSHIEPENHQAPLENFVQDLGLRTKISPVSALLWALSNVLTESQIESLIRFRKLKVHPDKAKQLDKNEKTLKILYSKLSAGQDFLGESSKGNLIQALDDWADKAKEGHWESEVPLSGPQIIFSYELERVAQFNPQPLNQ